MIKIFLPVSLIQSMMASISRVEVVLSVLSVVVLVVLVVNSLSLSLSREERMKKKISMESIVVRLGTV